MKNKMTIDRNSPTQIKGQNKVLGVLTGSLAGTITGIVTGIIFILIGIALSATIIGAVIGVPLVIIGIGTMILGPFEGLAIGFMGKKALCPILPERVEVCELQESNHLQILQEKTID